MMRTFLLLLPFTLLLGAGPQPARAEPEKNPQPEHVEITLAPEFSVIRPGETLFVAVRQDLTEGWHSYWRNPGDSGEPPRIKWTLPEGFTAGELHWPVPERITYGPLTNYGYEHKVTLLQEIIAPDPLPEGTLEVSAAIDILVCDEICIPEYHEASFTLNDGSAVDNSELIDAAYNAMPLIFDWPAKYSEDEKGNFLLDQTIKMPGLITKGNERIKFDILPLEWGIIDNSANTGVSQMDNFNRIVLRKPRGDRPLGKIGETTFLISFDNLETGTRRAMQIRAKPDPDWLARIQAQSKTEKKTGPEFSIDKNDVGTAAATPAAPQTGFGVAVAFALLGGLILNLMPCVFPILSMKALGLVKMSEKSPGLARAHGLAYTGGILLSFSLLAAILMGLQAGGAQIGWGFQLQNPLVVLSLCWLLFLIGLNLSGYVEIGSSMANLGGKWINRHALTGTFLTGVLATIVATPCTAPFMGIAIGYALTQPAGAALPVFLALGFGLALPYLLLSFFPMLRAALPKPGPWMQTFREFLAFPMYASAAWLAWVYSLQVGSFGLLYALVGVVGISFAIWMFRKSPGKGAGRYVLRGFALIVLGSVMCIGVQESTAPRERPALTEAETDDSPIQTASIQPFSNQLYAELQGGDQPIFVNMTAAWCITCKVNERTALSAADVKKHFAEHGIRYLKGDWTNQNPEITEYLGRYGRNGVPLYVFYGARNKTSGQRPDPVILPQILTPNIILTTLRGE